MKVVDSNTNGNESMISIINPSRNGVNHEKEIKIGIIGLGDIGKKVARLLLSSKKFPNLKLNLKSRDYNELYLTTPDEIAEIEINENPIPQEETLARIGLFKSVDGVTAKTGKFLDSNIIIYSARNTEKPFSSFKNRDDEYMPNLKVMDENFERMKGYEGLLVIVANPLEPTCERAHQKTGIPRNRIIATSADTKRLRDELRSRIKRNPDYMDKKLDFDNIVVPSYAVRDTIEVLLTGTTAPMTCFNERDNCFVINPANYRSQKEIIPEIEIYNKISAIEKQQYELAIKSITKRLKKLKLN